MQVSGPEPDPCPQSNIVEPATGSAHPGAYATVCGKCPRPMSRMIVQAQAAAKYGPVLIFPKDLFLEVVHRIFGQELDAVILHMKVYYSKVSQEAHGKVSCF